MIMLRSCHRVIVITGFQLVNSVEVVVMIGKLSECSDIADLAFHNTDVHESLANGDASCQSQSIFQGDQTHIYWI